MRIRHLRVRIKELASEARHIRHEEHQCSGEERWVLQNHRKTVVRTAARHYLLAYGYMRGTPYRAMEATTYEPPSWSKVKDIVKRFGGDEEGVDAWRKTEPTEEAVAA